MVGATARNGKNTPAAGGSANRMRVLVPCGDPAQADRLIQAGADELYLGFFDDGWVGRFGESADLNRMSGFGSLANKASFEDVLTACDQVSSRGGHLFVTLNATTPPTNLTLFGTGTCQDWPNGAFRGSSYLASSWGCWPWTRGSCPSRARCAPYTMRT